MRLGRGALALTVLVAFAVGAVLQGQRDGDWPAYGRDAGGERFSPLENIRRENVASLQVAWTFRTGDAYRPQNGRPTAFEAAVGGFASLRVSTDLTPSALRRQPEPSRFSFV